MKKLYLLIKILLNKARASEIYKLATLLGLVEGVK